MSWIVQNIQKLQTIWLTDIGIYFYTKIEGARLKIEDFQYL